MKVINAMTQVKYSYKSSLDSANSGGVYGNLKDSDSYSMIVFEPDLYSRKKYDIEHCSGDFILANCNHPKKATHIKCNEVYFSSDIISGKLRSLNLKLMKRIDDSIDINIIRCKDCSLRDECSKPVLPSNGRYNMMIVGEAPGRDEDKEGEGFVGKSGKLLWDSIVEYGYEREDFYITNVVKCYPSETKTPSKANIKKCSRWLDDEIKKVKPFIILSFGNTGLKYFTGEDKGIMEKNGTTEWNDKANSWVCYCVHPASVLYHSENKKLFDEGISNFARKIKYLGGYDGDR